MELISPKYLMSLVGDVESELWKEYQSYKGVKFYLLKWYETDNFWENFRFSYKDDGNIDLTATLHGIDGEILIKIAIDLGLDTPDFLPSIPTFKNDLKESYKAAFESFEKALRQVEENPEQAVSLANSTLESIIKEIINNDDIDVKLDTNKTLYKLAGDILKEFKLYPLKSAQEEIKVIGSSLLSACQHIEKLRSNKTFSHGKTESDYVIDDAMYAYFTVNSVSTIGLFLISFYNKNINTRKTVQRNVEEISVEDLPF